jgi:RHS repeat-associated protein
MGKTADAATSTYTWDMAEGLPLVLAETIGANTAYWVTGLGGLPLEEIAADGTVYYYHSDKLGSTRALSKDDGAVVATYDYGAYGNLTSQTGFLQPFQFAGHYSDAESGLQYLRARYYDPATEQFLTRDPLTPRTQLPYVYAQDSPPNRVDPSGLDSIVDPNSGGGGGPPSIGPAQEEAIAARIARNSFQHGLEISSSAWSRKWRLMRWRDRCKCEKVAHLSPRTRTQGSRSRPAGSAE